MMFVGIDPGRTGARVAVGSDGKTAIEHRVWSGQDRPPLGAFCGITAPAVVTVERAYLGMSPHAALQLGEWTGRLLERLPAVTVLRPNASSWRSKVLRPPARAKRDQLKRLAVELCRRHSGLPDELASNPDLAEAWCMARFAWGWAQEFGQQLTEVTGPIVIDEVDYRRAA